MAMTAAARAARCMSARCTSVTCCATPSSRPPKPRAIRATRTTTTASRTASATSRSRSRTASAGRRRAPSSIPARSRPNLRIETEALTDKVLLEGKRAVGVAYTVRGQKREARAGREVIVSCGAVQSPGVLEHSGIGQPELLRQYGIEVKHELKGVGENYGDHFAPRVNYRINQPISLNEQTRGLQLLKAIAQYYTTRSGVLTYNAGMVCGFVRTRPGLETPDMQLHVLPASYEVGKKRLLETEPGMTVILGQCRPDSRGSIHIKSATPGAEPAIRPNFLSARTDRDAAVAGMQIARRIMQQPAIARYVAFETGPGEKVQSYDEWLDYARHTGATTFHVDRHLQDGQRPDGGGRRPAARARYRRAARDRPSIMPTVPSGNTNAPTIMVAEKGADMIKEDAKAGRVKAGRRGEAVRSFSPSP